ncbi:MAG: sulfatase-like hydrolase/transferase, partial [Myxococcota bacterium]
PVASLPGGGLRRSAENVTARALETIDAWADTPFFLWLHYFDAHLPYLERAADRDAFPDAPYLAQVHALDRALGRVFERLEARGLREHTLVVVTSDHGEGLGEHDEPTHSYFVYDSTMRVPLLLWGPPSLPRGLRVETPARTVDLLPTILDLMERPVPGGLHGRSLAGRLRGEDAEPAPLVYGESLDLHRIFGTTPVRLLREGRWKYIHSAEPELYDLATDPGETRNMAGREPERAAHLAGRLRALVAEAQPAPDPEDPPLSAVDVARLEALGYVVPRAGRRLPDEIALLAPQGPPPRGLARAAESLSRAKGVIAARRYDRAIAVLAPLAEMHPESPTVLAMLAEATAGTGRADEALALFDRALAVEADPCSETRLDRARAFARFGRDRERIRELEDALGGCPDSATYLNELAWALATTSAAHGGDGERAVLLASRLVELGSGEPDPNQLDTLAAAWFAAGDPAKAAATQARALAILERSGAAPKLRAAYARSLARYRRAEAEAESEAGVEVESTARDVP